MTKTYKPLEISLGTLVCILAIILAVTVTAYLIAVHKPNFTIYKEICWNETRQEVNWHVIINSKGLNVYIDKNELIYLDKDDLFSRFLEKAIKEKGIDKNFIYCHEETNTDYYIVSSNDTSVIYGVRYGLHVNCFKNITEQKCEKKEVEYMYVENQTVGKCSKYLYYKDNTAKCIGKFEEWQEEVWLSSSDLAKSWLNENCRYEGAICKEGKEWSGDSRNMCINLGEWKDPRTEEKSIGTKYSCGDYEVVEKL